MILNFHWNIPSHIIALRLLIEDSTLQKAKKYLQAEANREEKIHRLKTYRCFHCNKKLVVLRTRTGSVLPVEINESPLPGGDLGVGTEFDPMKHTSHLKNCIMLRSEWEVKKKRFLDAEGMMFDV